MKNRWLIALFSLCVVGFLASSLQILDETFAGSFGDFLSDYVYEAVLLLCGAVCCLSARGKRERYAWFFIGAAMIMWAIGDIFYAFLKTDNLSYADIFYVSFYPLMFSGIGLMVLYRTRGVHINWFDGIVAAASIGALLSLFFFKDMNIFKDMVSFTSFAYVLLDLATIGFLAASLALIGRKAGATWFLLLCGIGIFTLSDSVYGYQVIRDSYELNTLTDIGWIAGFLLIAFSSLPEERLHQKRNLRRSIALPLIGSLASLGLIAWHVYIDKVNYVSLNLAFVSVVVAVLRVTSSWKANDLERKTHENLATTDALTGLGNRKLLIEELDHRLENHQSGVLALFDLNGFKAYNDSYGHQAGDSLLMFLGKKLENAAYHKGKAFRLGGDEFCVILEPDVAVSRCVKALEEQGPGFHISTAVGTVEIPAEASSLSQIIRIADSRMYQDKEANRAKRPTTTIGLAKDLMEAYKHTDLQCKEVTEWTKRIAPMLLGPQEAEQTIKASEFVNIGKMAIPNAITSGNIRDNLIDASEEILTNHSVIAERILETIPETRQAAQLVRCIEERYDGKGKPDGLAADHIPMGSFVLAACLAFAEAHSTGNGLMLLQKEAGKRFHPQVVGAFLKAVSAEQAKARLED